jgi:hypothetical protein
MRWKSKRGFMTHTKKAKELRHKVITLLLIERCQIAERIAKHQPMPSKVTQIKRQALDGSTEK